MNSFVFSRHTANCKYKRDRLYRRCNCPKWVEARHRGERVRKSASTRIWDEAKQFRQQIEDELTQAQPPAEPDLEDAPLATSQTAAPNLIEAPTALVSTRASAAAALTPGFNVSVAPTRVAPMPTTAPEILAPGRQRARVTVNDAVKAYMTDARSRGLQPDSIKKLERTFEKQFAPWCESEGLEYIDEVDLSALLTFRSTWHEGMIVKAKKQDRIIGFFWDAFRRNFISQNRRSR